VNPVIVPPRDANGMPDLNSLANWNIACDNDCGTEASLRDCSDWCISRDTGLRVYCPRCERRLKLFYDRRLLREAVGYPFRRYLKLVWRWGR
jgi:hypothetical protein